MGEIKGINGEEEGEEKQKQKKKTKEKKKKKKKKKEKKKKKKKKKEKRRRRTNEYKATMAYVNAKKNVKRINIFQFGNVCLEFTLRLIRLIMESGEGY